MTNPAPVAFYAPLKSPDHPVPSGDRTVARLMWRALKAAEFRPVLASRLRSLDLQGDPDAQRGWRAAAEGEADRITAEVLSGGPAARPLLWFTYHAYYKAPDHIGPLVAGRLGIPYVVAEPSRAAKRASGPWRLAHGWSEAGLDRADLLFAATARDAEALDRLKPPGQRIRRLPPFLDLGDWPAAPRAHPGAATRLLAVAMMRPGDKLASYRLLAEALSIAGDRPWTLTLAGDGPARREVARMFAPFGPRVRLLGEVTSRAALSGLYAGHDLLVWPAVNEAYGMALLEAQAMGCPVLAGGFGGVPDLVAHGATGVVTPPGDVGTFAAALCDLLDDSARVAQLGREATRRTRSERGLDGAAAILRAAVASLLARAAA